MKPARFQEIGLEEIACQSVGVVEGLVETNARLTGCSGEVDGGRGGAGAGEVDGGAGLATKMGLLVVGADDGLAEVERDGGTGAEIDAGQADVEAMIQGNEGGAVVLGNEEGPGVEGSVFEGVGGEVA